MKLDMVRSIGADHVMDYAHEDFTRSGQRYDRVVDFVAYRSTFDYRRALSLDGRYVVVGGSSARIFQTMTLGSVISMTGSQKMGLLIWKPNQKEDMVFLIDLLETGKVAPVIDRSYPLAEVPEALRRLKEGDVQGKVVITM